MLRIALSTLAGRKGGMLGAFAAVALAVVLVVSCGILLDSSLRAPIPVERLDDAAVVVQSSPTISGGGNVGVCPARARAAAGQHSPARMQDVRGVRAADRRPIVRRAASARDGRVVTGRDGSPSVGHGWASAALTPFALTSGHAPRSPAEIVLGGRLRRACGRSRSATAPRSRPRLARPLHGRRHRSASHRGARSSREAPVFFRDDVAARLSGERRARPT